MTASLSASQKRLLGALIGLSRAMDENNGCEEALAVMVEGLRAVEGPDDEAERLAEAAGREKRRAVPTCSACAHPCGRTADYDMEDMASLPVEKREKKRQMLEALIACARKLEWNEDDFQAGLDCLTGGLFALGYDWYSPEEMDEKIERVRREGNV